LPAAGNSLRRKISDHPGVGRAAHRADRGDHARDEPRHVATDITHEEPGKTERQPTATIPDESRRVATGPDLTDKYIARLEGEVAFLREETITKNAQIKELTERSRETNLLIGGLQRMLAPLSRFTQPLPKQVRYRVALKVLPTRSVHNEHSVASAMYN
jgi:hypothetical protein